MRYNYLSELALTLFPGVLGSTVEQVRGRITQIEMNPDLSIRSEVVRLWHTLFLHTVDERCMIQGVCNPASPSKTLANRGGSHGRSTASVRYL